MCFFILFYMHRMQDVAKVTNSIRGRVAEGAVMTGNMMEKP